MSTNTQLAAGALAGRQPTGAGRSRRPDRAQSRIGITFVSGYTLFLLVFGILPTFYAVYLAFTKANAFVGIDNFVKVFNDFRFLPALAHVGLYVAVWVVSLILLVVLLALIVHSVRARWLSSTVRFIYYIPGALAGASSVMLWLFVLDPTVSPVSFLLHALGNQTLVDTVQLDQLPVVLAIIAFWTGAGGWIVIMYGALSSISSEVMEAARVDGANAVQIAWRIQLPLLRKWISYMGIMSLAAGTQLFVEPQLLSQASNAVVPNDYSLNQLAYQYAFQQNDFNGAAAISLLLLLIALCLSAVFVTRGGLFETD